MFLVFHELDTEQKSYISAMKSSPFPCYHQINLTIVCFLAQSIRLQDDMMDFDPMKQLLDNKPINHPVLIFS